MHKLLVFDLDGTLAKLGEGITPGNLQLLHSLEQTGYRLAICSGKPTYYLCGFARQAELQNSILIGENGATLQFGVTLPPEAFYTVPYSQEAEQQLDFLRASLEPYKDQLWFQPNKVALTPFPKDPALFPVLKALFDKHRNQLDALSFYRQVDCFDIIPKNITKATGLSFLTQISPYTRADMVAIGNGENDIPMFQFADFSIGIGSELQDHVDICFDTLTETLHYIAEQNV